MDPSGQGGRVYIFYSRQALTATVEAHERLILETGGSLVSEPATFDLLSREFYTVWIRTSPEGHMQRVLAQGDLRPMANNPDAIDELKQLLIEREPFYGRADYVLSTEGRSIEACFDELTTEVESVVH